MLATKYVNSLTLREDQVEPMQILAERFDAGEFIINYPEVRAFCGAVGIDEPKTKRRQSSVRHIFDALAKQKISYLQTLIDGRYFSGPSRLSGISDAIRRYSRNDNRAGKV